MTTAKRMRTAAQRKAIRPKSAKSNSAKITIHHNVMKMDQISSRMIFLNPSTKVGREYDVEYHPREGWVFNRGQARFTYNFHKTRSAALKEMKEYAERHGIKYKPGGC